MTSKNDPICGLVYHDESPIPDLEGIPPGPKRDALKLLAYSPYFTDLIRDNKLLVEASPPSQSGFACTLRDAHQRICFRLNHRGDLFLQGKHGALIRFVEKDSRHELYAKQLRDQKLTETQDHHDATLFVVSTGDEFRGHSWLTLHDGGQSYTIHFGSKNIIMDAYTHEDAPLRDQIVNILPQTGTVRPYGFTTVGFNVAIGTAIDSITADILKADIVLDDISEKRTFHIFDKVLHADKLTNAKSCLQYSLEELQCLGIDPLAYIKPTIIGSTLEKTYTRHLLPQRPIEVYNAFLDRIDVENAQALVQLNVKGLEEPVSIYRGTDRSDNPALLVFGESCRNQRLLSDEDNRGVKRPGLNIDVAFVLDKCAELGLEIQGTNITFKEHQANGETVIHTVDEDYAKAHGPVQLEYTPKFQDFERYALAKTSPQIVFG